MRSTLRSLFCAAVVGTLTAAPALAKNATAGHAWGLPKQGTRQPAKKDQASPPPAAPRSNTLKEVTVTGKGASAKEALDDAIRTALRQVAGTFVRSDSKVQDDNIIQDRIILHSQGFVERVTKQGAPRQTGGVFEQDAVVVVRIGKVGEVLTEPAAATSDVDGETLAARVRALKESKASAEQLVDAVFDGFPANVMGCEIAPECNGNQIKPTTPPNRSGIRLRDDQVFLLIKIDVWVDPAKWQAWAKEAKSVFEAVKLSKVNIKLSDKIAQAERVLRNSDGSGGQIDWWIDEWVPWMSDAMARDEHLVWRAVDGEEFVRGSLRGGGSGSAERADDGDVDVPRNEKRKDSAKDSLRWQKETERDLKKQREEMDQARRHDQEAKQAIDRLGADALIGQILAQMRNGLDNFFKQPKAKGKQEKRSLKEVDEVSEGGVTCVAVMDSMKDTSFTSFVLSHELFQDSFLNRIISVELTLKTNGGEVGDVVPLPGYFEMSTHFGFGKGTGQILGACWLNGEFEAARNSFGRGIDASALVLVPRIVDGAGRVSGGYGWGPLIYCSRFTVPIGVVLSAEELESITTMDARVVVESR
jgi:hypothetical protein